MIVDLLTGNEIIMKFGCFLRLVDHHFPFEINTCYDPEWGDINLIYVGY